MIPKTFTEKITLEDGRVITLETGKLAKQADGSVTVQLGNCILLATVVSSRESNNLDFLPLTVDYREKFASAGRFPGGFFKREARPSTEEILTMRIIDRVLRPLFPKDYHSETQVMIQLMSADENVMADSLVGLAASTAIQLSDIPIQCPISEVRVGRNGDKFILNPTKEELSASDIDIIIGASEESIIMVEGEFSEISEDEMLEAIKFGHSAIKTQIKAQIKLVEQVGKKEARDYPKDEKDETLEKAILDASYDKCYQISKEFLPKAERTIKFKDLKESIKAEFTTEEQEDKEQKEKLISFYFDKAQKKAVRDLILNDKTRLDSRKTNEIRPIWGEVSTLPSTHGSAIFTRGETQALATTTLGTSKEANIVDTPTEQSEENFYLHYNFPPFSTGEAYPLRATSRREIGHGNLAQRALKRVIPQDCPYTIRIVSEVLESNGSSSMATVCAGTMALMDAGIQIKSPVSGIAMGLVLEGDNYAVLSDILGDEDHLGDMDFKVAGTEKGITACQMDIKVSGLSYEILSQALHQAKEGRLHILNKITEVIENPMENVKAHAPKMVKMHIPSEFIGAVIGPGGKNIQELQKESNTTIFIGEESETQGVVEILGVDQEKIDIVIEKIKAITFSPEVGERYNVVVKKILDFGLVVEFVPGKETLLHISEIEWAHIKTLEGKFSIGDELEVKYMGIDPKTRKPKVSRKVLLPKPEDK